MELNERKLMILQAIVEDYIMTGEPVGSRTIARKHGLGLSSATIRNEMSDLEEMGYLEQPHTSAGRVPSDKGYRFYVDRLMRARMLSKAEIESIKSRYNQRLGAVEQIIMETARILADNTNYTSLVLAPRLNCVRIKHVELVPISGNVALIVIVTTAGIVKDSFIAIPDGVDDNMLHRISAAISERVNGHMPSELSTDMLNDLENELMRDRHMFNMVMDSIINSLLVSQERDLYMEGANNLFNFPEYNDLIKARAFLDILEDKKVPIELLAATMNNDVSIIIGSENAYKELQDYSVITATYRLGDQIIGTIGVLGPKRMEYSHALSTVRFLRNKLSEILTKIGQ
ncbi:MAG: heat-inducible transcriptional repressor [Clostridiales bacterium]|nr:heat-inducible transcriptional repressor [Clostridiales bacterium]